MSRSAKPVGHVPVPLLIFGSVSLLLGMVAEIAGVFEGATEWLRGLWRSGGLEVQTEMGLPGVVGLMVTAAASFSLIGAILGTPGTGRRALLGFSTLFLTLSLVPAFAVWGIFWKPFGVVLAVIWAWFSAMVYSATHRMSCEEPVTGRDAENVIRMQDDGERTKPVKRSNGGH